jgi:filamentous hemagglutinin
MKKWIVLFLLGGLLLPSISPAIDLKQSKFTQVVNNVEIISAADKTRHAAAVNDIFSMPDVLRTGPDSRAELDAVDGTITRVGANTIFSFDPLNRTIDLQQGSLLFHSPKGKGGGTIRTGSATASVIGTTIIITATPNGGFKLLDLEGQAEVRFLNGINQTLEPGQMTFILPSGQTSPILVFRLDSETKGSTLVSGFNTPLDSQSKINSEITQQLLQILNGTAADTGLLVGDNATPTTVQVVQSIFNQQQAPPSGFAADGSIVGQDHVSTLPVNYPPLDPNHLQTAPFTPPSGIDSFSQGLLFLGIFTPASGFIGNNIDIDTAKVDLSSFAGKSDFDIMAAKDLRIWQSVDFDKVISPTPSPTADISPQLPDAISLIAGGQMLIASGSTLEADTKEFGMAADSFGVLDTATGSVGVGGQNTLQEVNIINNVGDVDVLSLSDFTFASGSISGGNDGSALPTGGEVEIQSDGTLTLGSETTISPAFYRANTFTIDAGSSATLVSSGQMTILDSQIDANAGDVEAVADGGTYIYGSDLMANSENSVGGDVAILGTGDVQILDTYISGNGGNVDVTSSGGDLTIGNSYDIAAKFFLNLNADGSIYLYNDGLSAAYGNTTVSGGGDVTIYGSTIAASRGLVDIESGGVLTVGTDPVHDVTITAGSDATLSAAGAVDMTDTGITASDNVSITSKHGGVDIYGSDIYADYGAVSISAEGSAYISGGDIESGDDTSTAYDVDINAGGTIDLEGIYVYATGDVNIESSDSLTLGSDSSDKIDASGLIKLKSDTSDVYVDYDLYAGGDVNITSGGVVSIVDDGTVVGGNIDVESSDIEAGDSDYASTGGNVNIKAYNGTVDIYNSYISASGHILPEPLGDSIPTFVGGDVTISGSGTVGIYNDSTIDAATDASLTSTDAGDVNVESSYVYGGDSDFGGSVIVDAKDGNVLITGSTLSASDDVTITGGNLTVGMNPVSESLVASYDTTITAGTDATLTGAGEVDITDASITAGNDVSITSDGSASFVSPGSLTISQTYSADNIDVSGSSITSESGDVSIINSGGFSVSGTTVSISDSDINFDNISISDSTITADNGGVLIEYDGQLNRSDSISFTISGSTLNANDIIISGSSITANNGDVDILDYKNEDNTGPDSVTEDSDVYNSDISITSDSTITANNGNVDIKTQNGGIDLENSGLYADDCIRLCADAGVTIDDDIITAGKGVKIHSASDSNNSFKGNMLLSGDNITAGTDATISGDGNVTVTGSTIDANGIVDIESGGTLTVGTDPTFDVTITAGSDLDLTANGSGCVNINDVYAQIGRNLNVNAGGNVSITSSFFDFSNDGTVGVTAGGYIDIIDTGGTGNASLTFKAGGYVNVFDSLNSDGSVNSDLTIGSWTVTAGSYVYLEADDNLGIYDSAITANGGDVTASADDGMLTISEDHVFPAVTTLGGPVSISYDIYASGNVSLSGDCVSIKDTAIHAGDEVDIMGTDGNVKLKDVDILTDSGDVNVEAEYGSLKLAAGCADYGINIDAGGSVNLSADYDVCISDATITAEDGDLIVSSGGAVDSEDETADGSVNISDYSTLSAVNGDVTITASGTSTGGITVNDSTLSAGGMVSLNAERNIDIESGEIDADSAVLKAGGYVNVYDSLNSSDLTIGSWTVTAGSYVNLEADDNLGIYDSTITANGGYVTASADDGMLTINEDHVFPTVTTASGADIVYDIYASGDVSLSGDCVSIKDTAIHAGDEVDIKGTDGNVKLKDVDILTDSGDVNVEADYGSLTLEYGCADYGVNINAAGSVSLTADDDVDIYGNDSEDQISINANDGDATITSYGGSVDAEDADIWASGNVCISSQETVSVATLDSSSVGNVDISSSEVEAGDSLYVKANGNVGINDSELTADDGIVKISAGRALSIENSGLTISGNSVTLTGGRGVSISDADITANDGDVIIKAESVGLGSHPHGHAGHVSPAGVSIYASSGDFGDDGSVDITAGDGDITVEPGQSIEIIPVGGVTGLSLSSSGDILISDTDEILPSGDVDIYSDSGNVDVESSTVTATSGNVNIGAGYTDVYNYNSETLTLNSDTIGAAEVVTLTSSGDIDIDDSGITGASVSLVSYNGNVNVGVNPGLDVSDSPSLTANIGDVDIYSDNGNVDVENSTVTATVGNVNIGAGYTDVYNYNSETLTLNSDTIGAAEAVTLTSSGDIDIDDSGITGASVSLVSYNGNVNVGVNPGLDVSDSPSLTANTGDVDINADYGNVDVKNSTITATLGNINIGAGISDSEGSETLTLNNDTISTGDVNGNMDYTSTSEYGDVSTSGGNVSISAEGSVSIVDSQINLNGNISISDSGIYASDSGDLTISTGGSFSISGGSLDLDSATLTGNNISISDSDVETSDGDVDIYNHGSFSSSFGGDLTIEDGSTVNVNNISITDSDIEADGGDVNIVSDGSFSIYTGGTDSISDSSTTINTIYISESDIYAYSSSSGSVGGNVEISAGGDVDVESSSIYADKDISIESTGGTLTLGEGEGAGDTIEALGNIDLTSDSFDVDINGNTYLYAYGGGINISATAGNVDIENSYLYASSYNNVDISSDTTISATGNVCIGADGGNVQIAADDTVIRYLGGDISIPDVGNLTINDTSIDMGGNVSICGSDITAGSGEGGSGDVEIDAKDSLSISGYDVSIAGSDISGSDIKIKDSDITANSGDVNIHDCDSFSISWGSAEYLSEDTISAGNISICDASITASGGDVNITSDGSVSVPTDATESDICINDISISDSYISASEKGGNDGDVTISASGNVGIYADTTIDAAGDVTISADGNVKICDSQLYFNSGNDIPIISGDVSGDVDVSANLSQMSINAGGMITLRDSKFYPEGDITISGYIATSDGSVNITTGGDINLFGSCLSISGVEIVGGSISISGSTVTADGGDVNIGGNGQIFFNGSLYSGGYTAVAGDILIYNSDITAIGGDVDINSGGTVTVRAFDNEMISGNNVTLTADGDVDLYEAEITANSAGRLNIIAGGVLNIEDIEDGLFPNGSTALSGDNVMLSGHEGVYLDWNAGAGGIITANDGSVVIESADGPVKGDNVAITATGSIPLALTGPNPEGGLLPVSDVDVYADYGDVELDNSTVTATLGNVDIEAGHDDFQYDYDNETLTLNDDTITAGGSVTLSAPGGVGILNVSTVGMTVDAVGITAGSISLLTHYHAIDLDVNDFGSSTLTAGTGDVDIYADNGDVDVQGSTIEATLGNVNIGAGFTDVNNYNVEQLTLNGVTITAGEAASLTSSGGIHVDDSGITAASITLETLYGVANLDANDFGSSTLTAGTGDADIYADNGNVDIEGSTIKATLGNVNIGAGYTDYKSETLTLNGGSITAGAALTLTAQSDVDVNVDSSDTTTLTAGSGDVSVTSYHGNVDVENATVTAGDSVSLTAPGTVTVASGSINANNNVTVTAGSGITINGTPITADDDVYGNITLTSTAGMTTIQNGASMTGNLTINSPDGILIDGSHGGTISGNTLSLTSGNSGGTDTITVNNEDLTTFASVNMAAHTLVLSDVAFGGTSLVTLASQSGQLAPNPNTSASIIPFDVNFIKNVTYGGNPAQNYIGSGITISTLP